MNKMTIKNTLVQPKDIPTIWSFAEKHLKKSVNRSYGRISLNDLFSILVFVFSMKFKMEFHRLNQYYLDLDYL